MQTGTSPLLMAKEAPSTMTAEGQLSIIVCSRTTLQKQMAEPFIRATHPPSTLATVHSPPTRHKVEEPSTVFSTPARSRVALSTRIRDHCLLAHFTCTVQI